MRDRLGLTLLGLVPAAMVLLLWEWAGERSKDVQFFFSTPTQILVTLGEQLYSGELIIDFAYTFVPTVAGFLGGVTIGSFIGFLLLSSEKAAAVTEWYVVILGSIPIFAIAPMMLIWFGIGLSMKVAMAFLATVFVALSHAYRGGRSVSNELRVLFTINGASERQIFWKLILPSSLDWVFASLRLSANLAVLGVFIGEYMASDYGLAHSMLKASALYNVPVVLAYALSIMVLIVTLDRSVTFLEGRRHRIIQLFAVDPRFQRSASI